MIVQAALAANFIQFVLHFLLASVVLLATIWNSRVMRSLMHIRFPTFYGPIVFGLGTAATQITNAVGSPGQGFDIVVDGVRAVAVLAFVLGLFLDSRRIVVRLAAAMRAIEDEFDGLPVVDGKQGRELIRAGEAHPLHCGPVVLATIDFALHGDSDEPPTSPRPLQTRRGT